MTIKSKSNVQKDISIPSKYDSGDREIIGRMIIERILQRTSGGIDSNGRAFRYVKGSEHKGHNLKETGDMLDELGVVSHSQGVITIGYRDTGSIEANQAEGQQIGTYGQSSSNSSIAKPFIGVSNEELAIILARYDQTKPSEEQEEITRGFISRFLKKQGIE